MNNRQLVLKRIDDFEKREPVKISIAGTDLTDSMLPHNDGRVGVVEEIACQMRNLRYDLLGNFGMSLGRNEHPQARGSEKRRDKAPGLRRTPGFLHYPGMGRYPQELVQYRPSDIPSVRASAPAFQPIAAGSVKRRVCVGGVYKNISVDKKH